VYLVDAGGRIAFLNPAAVKILGYAGKDELLGRPRRDTIHYRHPDGSVRVEAGERRPGPLVFMLAGLRCQWAVGAEDAIQEPGRDRWRTWQFTACGLCVPEAAGVRASGFRGR
jgi:PAS domain-containing protein